MDVPGVVQEKLEVGPGPVAGTLLVRATRNETGTDGQPVRRERASHPKGLTFARVVPVGWDADVSAARGVVADGILTIVVPKTEPSKLESIRPVETRSKS